MLTDTRSPLQRSIDEIGPYKLAKLVKLRGPSIYKWRENDRLPRTEWTGETNYAEAIVVAMKGSVTREQLLKLPVSTGPS